LYEKGEPEIKKAVVRMHHDAISRREDIRMLVNKPHLVVRLMPVGYK